MLVLLKYWFKHAHTVTKFSLITPKINEAVEGHPQPTSLDIPFVVISVAMLI